LEIDKEKPMNEFEKVFYKTKTLIFKKWIDSNYLEKCLIVVEMPIIFLMYIYSIPLKIAGLQFHQLMSPYLTSTKVSYIQLPLYFSL